jgi:hypothetical protein
MAVATACLLLVAGCSREPDGPRPHAAPAAAHGRTSDAPPAASSAPGVPEASAAGVASVEGRWASGDTESRYVAHFEGGVLRRLEEEQQVGGTRRVQRYWYEDGALARYEGVQPSTLPDASGAATAVPVAVELRGADVIRAVAREHSGAKKLDDATIDRIRRHAAALAGAAQDEWSARAR